MTWLFFLPSYSSGQFVQFPLLSSSLPTPPRCRHTYLPIPSSTDFERHGKEKKNSLIVKPPGSKCLQLLLLLTWTIGEEVVPARSSPKPPTLPNPWVLPTSFPEWWSSSICIHWHALERAGIPNQKLINGEKIQERSFYLTWNHDNHKVALGSFESDCCQIHVIFKNLDTFQWLYSCSVKNYLKFKNLEAI